MNISCLPESCAWQSLETDSQVANMASIKHGLQMPWLVTKQAKNSEAHIFLHGMSQGKKRPRRKMCARKPQGIAQGKYGVREPFFPLRCLLRVRPGGATKLCSYEQTLYTPYWGVKFAEEARVTLYHKNPDSWPQIPLEESLYPRSADTPEKTGETTVSAHIPGPRGTLREHSGHKN